MANVFKYPLNKLQPSQLFINAEKMSRILRLFDSGKIEALEPVPIKRLGDDIIFTDGHTRALAAHQQGLTEISVVWDDDELDWEAYEICVGWCKEQGIRAIANLERRVIQPDAYEGLWHKRCQEMHAQLKAKRK